MWMTAGQLEELRHVMWRDATASQCSSVVEGNNSTSIGVDFAVDAGDKYLPVFVTINFVNFNFFFQQQKKKVHSTYNFWDRCQQIHNKSIRIRHTALLLLHSLQSTKEKKMNASSLYPLLLKMHFRMCHFRSIQTKHFKPNWRPWAPGSSSAWTYKESMLIMQ